MGCLAAPLIGLLIGLGIGYYLAFSKDRLCWVLPVAMGVALLLLLIVYCRYVSRDHGE